MNLKQMLIPLVLFTTVFSQNGNAKSFPIAAVTVEYGSFQNEIFNGEKGLYMWGFGSTGSYEELVRFIDLLVIQPVATFHMAGCTGGGGESGRSCWNDGYSYVKSATVGDLALNCRYDIDGALETTIAGIPESRFASQFFCSMGWPSNFPVDPTRPTNHTIQFDANNDIIQSIINSNGKLTLDGTNSYWAGRIPGDASIISMECAGSVCSISSYPH
jgi:hypothetical protein